MRPLSFLGEGFTAPNFQGFKLVRARNVGFCRVRNAFLLLGTETAVGAEVAMNTRLRLEHSVGNSLSGVLNTLTRIQQLGVGAQREDRNILFKVVKDQRSYFVSPLLMSG